MAKPPENIKAQIARQLQEKLRSEKENVDALAMVVDKLDPKLLPALRFLCYNEKLKKLPSVLALEAMRKDADDKSTRRLAGDLLVILQEEKLREAYAKLNRAEDYMQYLKEQVEATKPDNVAAASPVASGAAPAEPRPARRDDKQRPAQHVQQQSADLYERAEDLYNRVRRHPDFHFFDDVDQRKKSLPRFATGGDSRADIQRKAADLTNERKTIKKWVEDQCSAALNAGGSAHLKDDGGRKDQFDQFVGIIRDLERQLPIEFWDLPILHQAPKGSRPRA